MLAGLFAIAGTSPPVCPGLCVRFGEEFSLKRLFKKPVGFYHLFAIYFILHNS